MMIAEHTHEHEVGGVVDRRGGLEPVPAIIGAEGGLIPELYFTDLASLQEPVAAEESPALGAAAIAPAHRFGLSDGIPFILGDDGGYDHDLNRLFRACPTMGVRSQNSLRAYGRDLVVWMRFLDERRDGKSVWDADREDVAAFHAARRRSEPPYRISAASWNRSVAALEKFYSWAVEEGLVAASPFGTPVAWRPVGLGRYVPARTSRAREPGARRGDLRFIGLDLFLLFRDVGLRGRLEDGRDDEGWMGRHGERNALFAEFLVTTGLRLEEAASLLAIELPALEQLPSASKSIPFRLPGSIAKGGRSREIRIPFRLLWRLHDYVGIERANALTRIRPLPSRSLIAAGAANRTSIGIADDDGVVSPVRLATR